MKKESKFWQLVKKKTPQIQWTRLESWASFGVPDLLGYNDNCGFFLVELKVVEGNKVRFSPHQIAFHVRHPDNTFILIKSLETSLWKLYEGKVIRQLAACGLKLDACCSGLDACRLRLASLGA